MKQRFTTTLITEQTTDDESSVLNADLLNDHVIQSVESEDYGVVEVIAVQTITERWDSETNRYVAE